MTDAMKVLYTYAQEKMICTLLAQEEGYARARQCAEKREQELFTLVGEQNEEKLEDLLDEQNELAVIYGRALFRAGFQIAAELFTNPA